MLKILYYNEETIISNLAESLVISGFPMQVKEFTTEGLTEEIGNLTRILYIVNDGEPLDSEDSLLLTKYMKRGKVLGSSKIGEGHSCYLKGVSFNVIISAPLYWMKQYQRYHFTDIISSCSTMHRITKMDLEKCCTEDVDPSIIYIVNGYIELYNSTKDVSLKEKLFRKIIANCPSGLILTQGITLNYLQLISMYLQRKNHKISEWSTDFVEFVENLPFFMELTTRN